jgi:TRAP-type C4-dicarboxylate transport system permease small subunit
MEEASLSSRSLLFRIVHLVTMGMNILGMVILVFMMLLTTADVLLRYFFNSPIMGSTEITEYMMVCLTLGVPFCTLRGKAVSMALVANKFPKQFQAFIDAFTNLIGFVAISFLSWQLYKEVVNAREISFSSQILNIPAAPFFGVLAFSMAMLAVSLLVVIAGNIAKGVRG